MLDGLVSKVIWDFNGTTFTNHMTRKDIKFNELVFKYRQYNKNMEAAMHVKQQNDKVRYKVCKYTLLYTYQHISMRHRNIQCQSC